jgi:SAM-dependent methyltransferase
LKGQPPEIAWSPPGAALTTIPCPNCGDSSPKPAILTIRTNPVHRPGGTHRLLTCLACTASVYEVPPAPDYGNEEMLTRGRAALYIQQGAGIGALCKPLFNTAKPPGASFLDIGCGFGFTLDFAARAKHWRGIGIDPGQLASLGCEMLKLDIEPRLLGTDEPQWQAAFDVVLAAETIEHVTSPAGFLTLVKNVLKPGGILILTTPDAGSLTPALAPGALAAALSPGQHVILQSAPSLRKLLANAGFSHITLRRDAATLHAFASTEPFTLQDDEPSFNAALRDYLSRRAADNNLPRDIAFGFTGRASFEAANHGDLTTVQSLRPLIDDLCRRHFGHDLAGYLPMPALIATASLEQLASLMPLNLAGILYATAIAALGTGTPRLAVHPWFTAAAAAAAAVQRAAGELAMADGLSEDLAWVCAAEALLCQAEAPGPDFIAQATALPTAPGANGTTRRQGFMSRMAESLRNTGHDAQATQLENPESHMHLN